MSILICFLGEPRIYIDLTKEWLAKQSNEITVLLIRVMVKIKQETLVVMEGLQIFR